MNIPFRLIGCRIPFGVKSTFDCAKNIVLTSLSQLFISIGNMLGQIHKHYAPRSWILPYVRTEGYYLLPTCGPNSSNFVALWIRHRGSWNSQFVRMSLSL